MEAERQIPRGDPPAIDNIALFLNVRSLVEFESADIAPGHVVRRAADPEIQEIQRAIQSLAGSVRRHVHSLWECRWDNDHTHTVSLERDQWRYFVIVFQGSNGTSNDLSMACDISSSEPDIGPILMHGEWNSLIHNAGNFFQSTEHLYFDGERAFVDVTREDIEEIGGIWQELNNHENPLWPTVRQIHQLKSLPSHSTMRFLGYFAILESLLTHLPQPTDPYDSITRQVKKKITLLNNRIARPLDYTPFGSAHPEAIWTKLYKYRSIIAHGGAATFDRGELATLRSPKHALDLVRSATKAVARQSLKEPQLLTDLREC
jgi:hypothetical protein